MTNNNYHNNDIKQDTVEYEVVVIGAGVAGCSAAYHLCNSTQAGDNNSIDDNNFLLVLDAGSEAGEGFDPDRRSGSATMDDSVAPCIKMMVQLFTGSYDDFVKHHGTEGARRYLYATKEGLTLQKKIAKEICWKYDNQYKNHMKELGSYYVAYKEDETELKQEFEKLQSCGQIDDIEWCDKSRLVSVVGMPTSFHCGIFFPNDAIIDSSLYAKTLLQYTLEKYERKVQFWPNSRVVHVQDCILSKNESDDYAVITLASGIQIRAKHIVMATGGLYQDPNLHGIIKPCYSYLVHVPVGRNSNNDDDDDDETDSCSNTMIQDSANFFTWNYTHDWCYTRGKIRCSGEDHFSAYKDHKMYERCNNLSIWTIKQYNNCYYYNNNDNEKNIFFTSSILNNIPKQYGIYSETPDMAPLTGHIPNNNNNNNNNNSRICYLLGCNAWGQTILSYCSSLIPGLLQYKDLTVEQKDSLRLLSIRRFSHLPSTNI